jgi:anhydro-N-acetylmuramic acid kinase
VAELYIGLMSGTSLDAADGILADFSGQKPHVLASATQAFSNDFRAELLALNSPSDNELHRSALAANQLAIIYSQVVARLLSQADIAAANVTAIGAHGQTVRHQPQPGQGDVGYTIQLNNPALLAEHTGIDVVADFRSRDVAAGGQGAPLVPAFHRSVFGRPDATALVLNIGGISNLSVLPASDEVGGDVAGDVVGFDCGPGNALMDAWCHKHTGQMFDNIGAWAASGQCIDKLLASLLDEPYLQQPPPKSTGRDLFSTSWLASKLEPFAAARPQDIQCTLTEFTAKACITGASSYLNNSKELIVCGGGAFNTRLMQRLQAGLPSLRVVSSSVHGLAPLEVEAAAFAWLARQTVLRLPGNLPSVTGAAGPRILGAIYPGKASIGS